jgi:bidirectional [NiFe] hydrogenase diaphorase subunit
MPEIVINGRQIAAEAGATVLETARRHSIMIPTLCHHPGLEAYGACRLCLVEVREGFRPGLTSSCTLPAMDGLVVETETEPVKEGRRLVAELLLARAPDSKEIKALAASLGVTGTDLSLRDERCILCGRCVRACRALGVNAIGFAFRGMDRRVTVPFDKTSERCLTCQACLSVCPTGAITAKIGKDTVEMVEWHTRQDLAACSSCGKHYIPPRQHDYLFEKASPDHLPRIDLCPACRRRQTARDTASPPLMR